MEEIAAARAEIDRILRSLGSAIDPDNKPVQKRIQNIRKKINGIFNVALNEKVCLFCGKDFLCRRSDAIYCGVNCRKNAYEKRRRLGA